MRGGAGGRGGWVGPPCETETAAPHPTHPTLIWLTPPFDTPLPALRAQGAPLDGGSRGHPQRGPVFHAAPPGPRAAVRSVLRAHVEAVSALKERANITSTAFLLFCADERNPRLDRLTFIPRLRDPTGGAAAEGNDSPAYRLFGQLFMLGSGGAVQRPVPLLYSWHANSSATLHCSPGQAFGRPEDPSPSPSGVSVLWRGGGVLGVPDGCCASAPPCSHPSPPPPRAPPLPAGLPPRRALGRRQLHEVHHPHAREPAVERVQGVPGV